MEDGEGWWRMVKNGGDWGRMVYEDGMQSSKILYDDTRGAMRIQDGTIWYIMMMVHDGASWYINQATGCCRIVQNDTGWLKRV